MELIMSVLNKYIYIFITLLLFSLSVFASNLNAQPPKILKTEILNPTLNGHLLHIKPESAGKMCELFGYPIGSTGTAQHYDGPDTSITWSITYGVQSNEIDGHSTPETLNSTELVHCLDNGVWHPLDCRYVATSLQCTEPISTLVGRSVSVINENATQTFTIADYDTYLASDLPITWTIGAAGDTGTATIDPNTGVITSQQDGTITVTAASEEQCLIKMLLLYRNGETVLIRLEKAQ
jgi:hypothetical protein